MPTVLTNYIETPVNLSTYQMEKLVDAGTRKAMTTISINLTKEPNVTLNLTSDQSNKIKKYMTEGKKTMQLRLSAAQLRTTKLPILQPKLGRGKGGIDWLSGGSLGVAQSNTSSSTSIDSDVSHSGREISSSSSVSQGNTSNTSTANRIRPSAAPSQLVVTQDNGVSEEMVEALVKRGPKKKVAKKTGKQGGETGWLRDLVTEQMGAVEGGRAVTAKEASMFKAIRDH